MPAVFLSASLTVSRLRSSISFSVTTVTDCGMSRSCCLPLPMVVSVARTASLPSGASARSFTVTVLSVVSDEAVSVWAKALIEPASSMAPRGNMAAGDAGEGRACDWARRDFRRRGMVAVSRWVFGWLQRFDAVAG